MTKHFNKFAVFLKEPAGNVSALGIMAAMPFMVLTGPAAMVPIASLCMAMIGGGALTKVAVTGALLYAKKTAKQLPQFTHQPSP